MAVKELIQSIKTNEDLNKCASVIMEVPEKPASHERVDELSPQIEKYLEAHDVRLYAHQAEVLEKSRAGKNVALATSTASGKTLSFLLPIFEAIIDDPTATALFLYPMKALAYDQLKEIKTIEQETDLNLRAAVYDGDTPKQHRRSIRDFSKIILSNPHALHRYLAWNHLWSLFFKNLRFIVIDEAHWYRGIYGTNVAFLLRRLNRILERYDANPQFIIASATMADPIEHAESLTGQKFELVKKDSSSQGKKTYLFWDTTKNIDQSQHIQTAHLTAACAMHGLQTLCFTVSRKMAELVATWANNMTPDSEIVPYRAGYLPEERRELEEKFKTRQIAGIASTNALELGINIGGLDAVVIGGYPGTISSFHQRAGRAGRAGQDSLVVQLIYNSPLDNYLLSNPDYLFNEPSEQAIISLGNNKILKNHIMCAAEESPLLQEDEKYFGKDYQKTVMELIKEQKLSLTQSGAMGLESASLKRYTYNGKNSCFNVSLSDIDSDTYRLVCNGATLEQLTKQQAYYEAHPNAVFLHRTEPYRIISLNEETRIIEAKPCEKEKFTTPLTGTKVNVEQIIHSQTFKNSTLNFGKVTVTETVYGYTLRSYTEVITKEFLKDPLTLQYKTEAAWINLGNLQTPDLLGGLHAAEHLLIGVAPLLAMCDRWDLGGVSVIPDNDIFIYDGFPDGIGISERLYQNYHSLATKALDVVANCSCVDGCPKCIISPKCGNNNEPLDKESAILTLRKVLG